MLYLLRRALTCILAGSLFAANAAFAELSVSEFSASNVGVLQDASGSTPDWIELHNSGSQDISLGGWSLTDEPTDLDRWPLPDVMLPGGAYLTVFASGDDGIDSSGNWHTNFRLDADGEYLALTAPDGSVAQDYGLAYPPQYADISYGLANGQPRYFSAPTPGTPNGPGKLGVVADIAFSVRRGFYDSSFELTLTPSAPGALVRYTIDGSTPTETHGFLGKEPFTISGTTVVRAIATKSNWVSSEVFTHSYVFVDDVAQQPYSIPGYPNPKYDIGSGNATATHDYEMDPAIANDPAYAADLREGLLAIPTISIGVDPDSIFNGGGFYDSEDVEAACSIEVIYPDDSSASQQENAGIESHSHKRLKRSLRLNFRSQYGASKFETDLFQRAPLNGSTAATEVDKIVLRAGNNRSWARNWNPSKTTYAIDEFYRASQLATSGFGARGHFAHLYINGIYWGLYNPIERVDQHFSSEYFGGHKDDWFAVNHSGPVHGDSGRYDYLVNNLAHQDLASASKLDLLSQYLDIDAFSDYLILSWWSGTGDWPSNNWYAGNRNETSSAGPSPLRYYAWDGEWSWDAPFGFSNSSQGAHVHPDFASHKSGGPTIARLWHAVRANDEFMISFADRVHAHVNNDGPLSDSIALDRWHSLNDVIENAVVAESARWGDALAAQGHPTRTRDDDWQDEVDNIRTRILGNANRFIEALRDEGYYPGLNAPTFQQHGGAIGAGFDLNISAPTGSVWYTTNGTDPRNSGGSVNSSATKYTNPVHLTGTTIVSARAFDGTVWSALTRAQFISGLEIEISEIMADNKNSLHDEAGDADDWIELHNLSSVPVDLSDMYLTDDLTHPTQWRFPENTQIPGNGHLIVWADNDPEDGPLHATFKLSKSGDHVGLFYGDADGAIQLAGFSFGEQATDASLGQLEDSGPLMLRLLDPSPGAANDPADGQSVRYEGTTPHWVSLSALDEPIQGESLTLRVTSGQPLASGLLLFGSEPILLPIGAGNTLLLLPAYPAEWRTFATDTWGTGALSIPLPTDVGLIGLTLYAQALVGGTSLSNGLAFTMGQ